MIDDDGDGELMAEVLADFRQDERRAHHLPPASPADDERLTPEKWALMERDQAEGQEPR